MPEQEQTATQEQEVISPPTPVPQELQELLDAGAHFGHKKSAVHPAMFPYIFATRNNVHIFDVEKTQEKLKLAQEYLAGLVKDKKTILFIGTRPTLREMVRSTAEELHMPYIVTYWAGGTFTNWDNIKERVARLKELEEKQKSEEWDKYTKHERLRMTRLFNQLQNRWGGIKAMDKLPDAVFVVDMQEDALVAKEAHLRKIPVIAIADTNINPEFIDYIIPANDDAIAAVRLILARVSAAMSVSAD